MINVAIDGPVGAGKSTIAKECAKTGEEKTIVFGLTGTGYFDMFAYERFHDGKMTDYTPSDEDLAAGRAKLPMVP